MSKQGLMAAALLLIPIAAVAYAVERNIALKKGFDEINPGALRAEVIRRLGKPSSSHSPCEDSTTWLDRQIDKSRCVVEIRYEAPFLPKYWMIGFDQADRAIAKYEYVSP
jgi:hypothetical protein